MKEEILARGAELKVRIDSCDSIIEDIKRAKEEVENNTVQENNYKSLVYSLYSLSNRNVSGIRITGCGIEDNFLIKELLSRAEEFYLEKLKNLKKEFEEL